MVWELVALKASIIRRIERLEEQFEPSMSELSSMDLDLLIESETEYLFEGVGVLRVKGRDFDEESIVVCFEDLNDEEMKIIETLHEIIEKCIRLTASLSEEEKAIIREYNDVVRFFGSNMMMSGAEKGWWKGFTEEERLELRVLYEQLMAKYGERIYE